MRFIIDIVVIVVLALTALFLYKQYWEEIKGSLWAAQKEYTVYLGSTALSVSIADTEAERTQGLSGTPSLHDLQGKLFIFEKDAKHGFWMKDMLFPIDIIWIDKDLRVVHMEQNVEPKSYPDVFAPPVDARFVLEMNAHFVSSLKVQEGDRLTLPSALLPDDIKSKLQ